MRSGQIFFHFLRNSSVPPHPKRWLSLRLAAYSITAEGKRPRKTKISIRPERATQTLFLVPQIRFVIRRTIFFQNPQILLLKCLFPVMLLLSENVLSHRFEMRRAYAEKTVTILPMKVPKT